VVRVTDDLGIDTVRPTETVCPSCWLIYNAALGACPTLDCE
jgi:hypothetical protein